MKDKFSFKIWLIFTLSIVVSFAAPIFVYFLSGSIPALLCAAAGIYAVLVLMVILHKTDDRYISQVVSELSELIDALTELEEKAIFPENKDNMLSKLQTKVIRLVRILKKNNERNKQDCENIKSLVSDISHQLKTPISNLKMYSDFLSDDELTENERREYIAVLCQSVQRLTFLSESMIKISRLESGIINLNMQRQSLNETALKAVRDIYAKAKEKETEIVYSEECDIILTHDRSWTSEAIFNLLDNAVKYSKKGAKIYLSLKKYGMFSAIEVRDENPPIPESEKNKLFTRFYRGKNSSGKEGIGIGLYLVKEIAIRQGGYIKLDCDKAGNTFALFLGADFVKDKGAEKL